MGEARIANYLFSHDIEYTYEKVYSELMDDNKIYKPDFTINIDGEDIYIEYFGLSNYKENELNKYNRIKKRRLIIIKYIILILSLSWRKMTILCCTY